MGKVKYSVVIIIISGGLFFLFCPKVVPNNLQPQEILNVVQSSDVIIFFNSGGWGNTPFEKAEDFGPIVKEIQATLEDWGYDSVVIPYNRTKNSFLGKVDGARDFLNYFESSSNVLAGEIEFLTEKLPEKKIIVAGLSAGGAFVTKTYDKISERAKDSILTIAAGTPFWLKSSDSQNILQLDNDGKDSLSRGEIKALLLSLVEPPIKWISARISGEKVPLSLITNQFVGHYYDWETASPEIISFLEEKMPDRGNF
jgi:pimeloyl-ACP methyl ester carboxylesterase